MIAAGLAGCGGGDKKPAGAGAGSSAPTVTATATAPATTPAGPAPTVAATTPPKPPAGTSTSPSGGSGGNGGGGGGSEPARTELTFVAMGTRFTPQSAGVAPFIAVKVTLVARDMGMHALTIGGTTLVVDRGHPRATATLPGLRPGRSYVGHTSRGQTVRILSTSEPGP